MNNIEFKSTFDEIEYDIAMDMYMKHNSKIASINEHLGEMYSYKDLEEAKALEEYDTLQEYKKALKEKCDAFDKVIDYIDTLEIDEDNNLQYSSYSIFEKDNYNKNFSIDEILLKIEDILRGKNNE